MSNEQEKMLQSCYMLADDSDESNSDFEIEFIGIPSEDAGTSSEDADTSSEDADRVAFQPFHTGAYCVADGVLQPGFEAMAEEDFAAEEEDVAYSNDLWAMSITGPQQPGAGDAPLASTSSYEAVASTSREEPVASTSRHRGHRRGIRGCRGRGISSSCGSSGENVGVTRSAWSRGEPLVECFPTDEDLPQLLREEIIRLDNKEHSTPRRKMKDESMEDNDVINDIYVSVSSEEYVWKPMDEWHGEKESFLNAGSSGPTRVFEDEYDAFRSFWDDTLLQHIADETNRYARTIQSDSFQRDWFPTNAHEILMLFAFWMVLGIHSLPSIKSCYSKNILLRTDIFRLMFTHNRYYNLNRAFHLGNGSHDANSRHSVLAPMGPVLDVLNSKFKENYQLQQDICIDESLILWKGPLKFSQYIKSKSAKLGIKMYQLCESSTSYLWSFFVYAGRETTTSTAPLSFSTVIKLVEPLLDLGHVLYLDNWFNTPTLARYLKRRKTDCVGTLRLNRRNVPAVIQKAPISRGQFLARQCGDVMVCSFHDHRPVACISTFHDVTQIQRKAKSGRSSRFLLKLNDDYNHNMGGVDHLDQMLVPYLIERKQCAKWNKKLFKRLLNISIQNARILLERSRGTRLDVLSFRTMLGQSIIDRHRGDMPQRNPQNTPQRPHVFRDHFPEGRLTERHFIRRIPITQQMRDRIKYSNNLGRRECVWCTAHNRKGKKTVYECEQCEMALCLKPCFKEFHTVRF